ncbi:MAG: hypothetical protein A3E84_00395 [Gammaproteobacteria bacterium RIFCSPHIGHO2_12_FULL_42_13]|nr:MAG: hypothetical protein A3E84_00395 [Gammaproteobacteria bacterium RIFCSPHIGHO2_12_FULL_42_13]
MEKKANPSTSPPSIVTLAERETLIRAIPVFRELITTEIASLASLMTEVYPASGDKIVTQGELVDSVYIIASGTAEVSKKMDESKKSGETLLATLSKGETIGLSETGIFTTTGTRMATVTATSPCILLRLDLIALNQFLHENKNLAAGMRESTEWMLHMHFIKAAAPFAQFSNERIAWLANLVKAINVEADTVIFKEGEAADSCYLVCEGKIQISKMNKLGQDETLTVLQPFDVFGEAALLTSVTRNASASALTPCRLLLLDREAMLELLSYEGQSSDYLMTLIMERSKPVRADNIIHYQRTAADGQLITTLKNPQTGNYFQLSEQGWFIWRELDGKKTLEQITMNFHQQYQQFKPDFITRMIAELASHGFAYLDASKKAYSIRPGERVTHSRLYNILNAKYQIPQPDKKIDFLYQKGLYIVCSKPAFVFSLIISLIGLITFFFAFNKSLNLFKAVWNIPLWLLAVIVIGMTVRTIRALGEALAVKAFNHEVYHFSIGWRWIGPIAIADLSDMWLAPRWQRTIVNSVGTFIDLMIAGLFSLYAFYTTDGYNALFAWLVALYLYLQFLRSLDPMLDLDGYRILMGLFDVPDLRESAINKLTELRSSGFKDLPHWAKHNLAEAIFWLSWLTYVALIVFFIVLVQYKLLMPLMEKHFYLALILPAIFICLSIFTLWSETGRRQSA